MVQEGESQPKVCLICLSAHNLGSTYTQKHSDYYRVISVKKCSTHLLDFSEFKCFLLLKHRHILDLMNYNIESQ